MTEYIPFSLVPKKFEALDKANQNTAREQHYEQNSRWFTKKVRELEAYWLVAGGTTGRIYASGDFRKRLTEKEIKKIERAAEENGELAFGYMKEPQNDNRFYVDVAPMNIFATDDECFSGEVNLFFPEGVFEQTGHDGYSIPFRYRNAQYVELIQAAALRDLKKYAKGMEFPIEWTERAEQLRRARQGIYLPEKNWDAAEAQRVLSDSRYWHPRLDDKDPIGFGIDDLALKETAEHIVRTTMRHREASEFLSHARRNGLTSLKSEWEGQMLHSLLSGVQIIRDYHTNRRGESYFESHIEDATKERAYYERICSRLGAQAISFDFPEQLRAMRSPDVPFGDVARVIVATLRSMGKTSLEDYMGFDVEIGADHARVSSTTFIEGKKVKAEL